MTSRWRTRLIPLACLATALAVAGAVAPRPPASMPHTSGDRQLAQVVENHRPAESSRIAVSVLADGEQTFTGLGADQLAEFEIGSISKVFTGMLLADAVDRGEVTLETPLGEILDVQGTEVAAVTLQQLATHTSGLSRLPASLGFMTRAIITNYTAGNPYTDDVNTLIDQARSASVGTPGEFEYSNFGTALLGQALAEQAGLPYADLLRDRITEPLGMADTYVPADPDALRPDAVQGYAPTGKAAKPWTMGGMAPAGGVRSTTADLSILVEALLDGTAPGASSMEALDLTAEPPGTPGASETPMGLAWFVGTPDDPTATSYRWHNGQTGGFSSMLVLDLDAGRASIVLSNTSAPVDSLGMALLDGATDV